jgi:hypothetical protein
MRRGANGIMEDAGRVTVFQVEEPSALTTSEANVLFSREQFCHISIQITHSHMRVDYYWVKQHVTKSLKNKLLRYCFEEKTFRLDILPAMTSNDIYMLLKQGIEELMRKEPFRKYYIDIELFQNIGPYIDWRTLLDADI